MTKKKAHSHDDPCRTTAIGMVRYAVEFMQAALAADDGMGNRARNEVVAPIPVMFLVGQAIELALKAYLLSQGVPLRQLRREYGHELHRSLRKAKELGLGKIVAISADDEYVLSLLDDLYASKQLQYIVTGAKIFPVFGPLERVALQLIHAVGTSVGYRTDDLPRTH